MADKITVKISGRSVTLKEFTDTLKDIPLKLRGRATKTMLEYLRDEFRRQSISYPAYRHVTRENAYGNYHGHNAKGWKSAKQRRFVMMKIRSGEITPGTPRRTGAWARGWQVRGDGVKSTLYNDAPGVQWGHGEDTHAMQLAMVGWSPLGELIENSLPDAMEYTAEWIKEEIIKMIK